MKRNTLFSFLTVAALGLLTAGPANAQCTFTWTGATNDNFREAGNWTKSGSCVNNWPLTGNIAIFPNVDRDVIINDQNEAFGDLEIQSGGLVTITGQTLTLSGVMTIVSGGTLNVQANGTADLVGDVTHPVSGVLDIDADGLLDIQDGTVDLDSANTHPIGGEIRLSGNGSTLKASAATTLDIAGTIAIQDGGAVLDLDANVTASGAGEIKGEHDDAQILIATDKVLTSSLSIVGQVKIVGLTGGTIAGKLDNRGLVHANAANGILLLDSNLIVVDTSGDRWDASGNTGAVLQFGAGIACDNLAGDFNLDGCATLQFDGDVYTSGTFTAGNGFIDVVGGGSLNASCNSGCTSCTTVVDSDTSYGSC